MSLDHHELAPEAIAGSGLPGGSVVGQAEFEFPVDTQPAEADSSESTDADSAPAVRSDLYTGEVASQPDKAVRSKTSIRVVAGALGILLLGGGTVLGSKLGARSSVPKQPGVSSTLPAPEGQVAPTPISAPESSSTIETFTSADQAKIALQKLGRDTSLELLSDMMRSDIGVIQTSLSSLSNHDTKNQAGADSPLASVPYVKVAMFPRGENTILFLSVQDLSEDKAGSITRFNALFQISDSSGLTRKYNTLPQDRVIPPGSKPDSRYVLTLADFKNGLSDTQTSRLIAVGATLEREVNEVGNYKSGDAASARFFTNPAGQEKWFSAKDVVGNAGAVNAVTGIKDVNDQRIQDLNYNPNQAVLDNENLVMLAEAEEKNPNPVLLPSANKLQLTAVAAWDRLKANLTR